MEVLPKRAAEGQKSCNRLRQSAYIMVVGYIGLRPEVLEL